MCVQLFLRTCKLHIFSYKVLHFLFRTIVSVIFLLERKMSVLLHSVNTVAIAAISGDYDGDTGPSQPERKTRKSTRHIFVSKQLARDLHDVGVELDTELSTMANIIKVDDSGCEPKRKRAPQKSKLITSRLENARRSKHVFKIRNIESVNAEHCKFGVGSGNSARTFYQVHICTQPSCSCPDFNTYGIRSLCKHILFVLLFALEMTDINILDKTEFETHEVVNFLKKSNIDPAFKAKKATGAAAQKKSAGQFRSHHRTRSQNKPIC